MPFVFALGFALTALLADLRGFGGTVVALLAGLAIGAWLTALIDGRIRRIAGAAPRPAPKPDTVHDALEDIHWRLKRLEQGVGLGPSPMEQQSTPADAAQEPAAPPLATPAMPEPAAALRKAAVPAPVRTATPAAATPAAPVIPAPPADDPLTRLLTRFRQWLFGGNSVVRVGIVVLFFGVAFLLKFAAEHAVLPLELRVAGIGLGALVLLALGWRLRTQRAAYALALQGAGVGLLYLTLFGAFRLYELIPPLLALTAMIAVSGLSAALAILQNSRTLIAFGVTGGFLAPILASTGNGSHVALFSYYAVINLGVFAVAWFKAWRPLNLLGFFFTFGIGLAWGTKYYQPELFASTEIFLLLFFVMFLTISILFAQRQAASALHALPDGVLRTVPKRIVDSTLVFGLPLVAFGFQAGLMRDMEFALAYSALALAALYLALARWLHGRDNRQLDLLVESFLALGVIFGTLAIPLALDARWTSASWALEGAALTWVGIHQQRRAAVFFGLLLQIAAGVAWAWNPQSAAPGASVVPVLNAVCLGALLIALSGLFSAWQLQTRMTMLAGARNLLALSTLIWGLLWWTGAGFGEAGRLLAAQELSVFAALFFALTALAMATAQQRLDWSHARLPAAALILGLASAFADTFSYGHPFADGGWIAWPLALFIHFRLLHRYDTVFPIWYSFVHAAGFWLLAALGSRELYCLAQDAGLDAGWTAAALIVTPGLLLYAISHADRLARWPLRNFAPDYLGWGAIPVLVALALWCVASDFHLDGSAAPLPYLPLLNPIDIGHVLVALAGVRWALLAKEHAAQTGLTPRYGGAIFGALAFIWLNAMLLRSIHHWADVPYTLDALLDSLLVQAALSLFWSLLALLLMLAGARRNRRVIWMTGAALMVMVVGKLFLVDLGSVGSVARIVSFIGVGLLMLVIGYIAPVPPKPATTTSTGNGAS